MFNKLVGLTNAGYKIIASIAVGSLTIVLGFNDEFKLDKFVTWAVSDARSPNYFWGHYFVNYADARRDLLQRAADEAAYYANTANADEMPPLEALEAFEAAAKN